MGENVFLNRLLITGYAIVKNIVNKNRPPKQTKNIVIVFQQIFGDAIVFTSSLQGYVDLYVTQGYTITLLCRPVIAKFLAQVAYVPKEIKVETVDFKRIVEDFSYYREVVNKYEESADIVVVPGTSLSAEVLCTSFRIKRRIGLVTSINRVWPPQMVLYKKMAYTEFVKPEAGLMMIQRHRYLLNYLGNKSFKGKLPCLKKQERMIEGDYCVVCPGASTFVKCWPIQRYIALIDILIEKYNLDVHLCGGTQEKTFAETILKGSKYADRLFNHLGETTFSEWSSIVQFAKLVVGNDSATLHIAAATRRNAICIAGVYDKFQFFPYLVDELDDGDRLPNTIYVDKPCAFCRTKGYYHGYGNSACQKAIRSGRCALCIDDISLERVIKEINAIFD